MLPGVLASVLLPLAFLYAVWRLDLYARGGFDIVVVCALWGLVAFALSFLVNRWAASFLGLALIGVAAAPVVEEIVKSVSVVHLSRRPTFTYFVDGAIYGFAAGTAFAVVENLYYLSHTATPLILGMNRAFSTSLMHGTATALVGVSIGYSKLGRSPARTGYLALGWVAATLLHAAFNGLVYSDPHPAIPPALWAIGLGGLALTLWLVRRGLREEREWLRETLKLDVGVSDGEAAIVDQVELLGALLAPVRERFGEEKRRQVEQLVRLQARIGLKHKMRRLTRDDRQRERLAAEVEALTIEMDELRRKIGVYCMTYVRSILPQSDRSMWERLEVAVAQGSEGETDIWRLMGERLASGEGSA